MIELRHLKTMVALRDSGSLIEAADSLCLTQSALSHQLRDLEDRLGCRLFARKTRPPQFTSVGRRLLAAADEILPLVDNAERDIIRLTAGETGRLHIGIECHSCFQWLTPCLDHYRNDWPQVNLDLTFGFNFAPLPALTRGDLDLVVTSDPEDMPGVAYTPLFTYEAFLVACKQHPLAAKPFVQPRDLADMQLITYPVDRNRLDIFTQFLDPADVEPAGVRTAELTAMILQLVAAGRGLACLPSWAVIEHQTGDSLHFCRLGKQGLWCTLYAAVREDQQRLGFMQAFLQMAVKTSFDTLEGIGKPERRA